MELEADAFNEMYGLELKQAPLRDAKTPRMMRKALLRRNPPIIASKGMLRAWFAKHHAEPSAARIASASSIPTEDENSAAAQAQEETPGTEASARIWETVPVGLRAPYGIAREPGENDLVSWESIFWEQQRINDYPERRGIALNRWMHALQEFAGEHG